MNIQFIVYTNIQFYSMNFDKILRGEIERVFEALKIY